MGKHILGRPGKAGIEVDEKTWKAFQDLGAKHGIAEQVRA
jgi:hypothetical protein